jgi:hypothetical protein
MGYNSLNQHDHDHDVDHDSVTSWFPPDQQREHLASPVFAPPLSASLGLFLDRDHDENTSHDNSPSSNGFNHLIQSIASGRSAKTNASYDMLEGEDLAEDARSSPALYPRDKQLHKHSPSPDETFVPLHIPHPQRRRRSPSATAASESSTKSTRSKPAAPILRTASGQSIALRHPTPDLQVLQGAYTGNIEHLERTAERLSMTSSIDDAIRELHEEQKRSDSRRSSLLESQGLGPISRQVSNASSIVEVNSAARSGGYSPAGFMMSPKGSFTAGSGRGRSASKSSRFGSRPEPELEGRPLDSFVNPSLPASPVLSRSVSIPETSPVLSRSDSIPEQDENSATLTRPIVEHLESPNMDEMAQESYREEDRPVTSASHITFDQSQTMFADFDGVHVEPPQRLAVSGNELNSPDNTQKRASLGNRMSMARPQSYADPNTGQQMVYYPAPVPMMLNLPQKLSKNPSSMARNKRRSQVLSSIPQAARQSAIWLPDVLETEDEPDLAPDDPAQRQEYIPQHQRMTMGGRRNTQDISHLPPQLRANTFFDLPGPNQIVELKGQSAVATLDSILDASAHAPVSAFTDHAFAGRLGAEVYGREHVRNSKSTAMLLDAPPKKRTSSFNILRGRRASSSDVHESDKEKRRATMSGLVEGNKARQPIEDDDEDDENGRDTTPLQSDAGSQAARGDYGLGQEGDEEEQDEMYHGPPTTLLAELQLRKQQQKHRTRPLTSAFPNGVHSTLLELDAVAQVEQKTRKQRRVNLAWEDPSVQQPDDGNGDDEDIPLGLLYTTKSQIQERNRPMGLMERRDMEDNEPLSRRRDRLQGRPLGANRASTMMNLSTPMAPEDEGETLAQRVRRLKDAEQTVTGLPSARPVSGDFASEMMSQFGGNLLDPKGKGKEVTTAPEEEETLGQRRKRLQAEREARALEVGKTGEALERPATKARRSMADILQAHPAASGDRVVSYQKPASGLLGLHEKKSQQRASTMLNFNTVDLPAQKPPSGGFKRGQYNDGQGGIIPPQPQQQRNSSYNMFGNVNAPQFAQPSLGGFNNGGFGAFNGQMMMPFANPYAMNVGYMNNMQGGMNGMSGMGAMNGMGMLNMNMGAEPLSQGQIDMVERWRQSVMQ